jgi:hypothetical protein
MKRTDPGKIQQDIFSAAAKVQKKADGGLSWVAKGPANVATRVDTSTPVMFFNSSTTVAYVSFATTSTGISAPTGAANGLPVPGGQTVVYNSGSNCYYIASAATILSYQPETE